MTNQSTAGWHWKQTNWNNYALSGPDGQTLNFSSYQALCDWCDTKCIDAKQA